MRFYDPSTTPPTRLDSLEHYPSMNEHDGARKCLEMGFLPSVTTVLKSIREEHLEKWMIKEGIAEYTQNGGDVAAAVNTLYTRESPHATFGKHCHAVAENWFGAPMSDVTEQVKAHTAPLLRWLDENVATPVFSERMLADKELGVAGAVDLGFIHKDGRRIVGDIKVVKFSKKYPPIPGLGYRCQLSAYAQMLANDDGHHYERVSFYLASPFGYDKDPCLTVFEYDKCYLAPFKAARIIWEYQLMK